MPSLGQCLVCNLPIPSWFCRCTLWHHPSDRPRELHERLAESTQHSQYAFRAHTGDVDTRDVLEVLGGRGASVRASATAHSVVSPEQATSFLRSRVRRHKRSNWSSVPRQLCARV